MTAEIQQFEPTEADLSAEAGVIALMETSSTPQEFHDNMMKVRDANGGDLPAFWNSSIFFPEDGPFMKMMARWESERSKTSTT